MGERFSVIFIDPPYESSFAVTTLEELSDGGLIAADGVVVVQHRTKTVLPERVGALSRFKAKHFGETTLTFFRRVE